MRQSSPSSYDFSTSLPIAIPLVIVGSISGIACLCLVLSTYYSTGPIDARWGHYLRESHSVQYRYNITQMTPNGQNYCMNTGILAAFTLVLGLAMIGNWRAANT